MQKTEPLSLVFLRRAFVKFKQEMSHLPSGTVLYFADTRGHILKTSGRFAKGERESICQRADITAFPLLHLSRIRSHPLILPCENPLDFIVISLDRSGFLGCVEISVSEDSSANLSDYLSRLLCFRNFIESFSDAVSLSKGDISPKRLLEGKISGISELLSLYTQKPSDSIPTATGFLSVLCKKLVDFISMTGRSTSGRVIFNPNPDEAAVCIPLYFAKLCVCCTSLALRSSANAEVEISCLPSCNGFWEIRFSTLASKDKKASLMEKGLYEALSHCGVKHYISKENGEFSLGIFLEEAKPEAVTVREARQALSEFEAELLEKATQDLFFSFIY